MEFKHSNLYLTVTGIIIDYFYGRCPECNVFVASLSNHKDMKHNPDRTVNKLVLTTELVVVRYV